MGQDKTDTKARSNPTEAILAGRVGAIRFFLLSGFIGVGVFCILLTLCGLDRDNPPPRDTINPNTDPAASLVRLPGIGMSRAMAILEYRQSQGQNGIAFQTPQDLDAVAGLGPKTIEKMEKWLSVGGIEQSSMETRQ